MVRTGRYHTLLTALHSRHLTAFLVLDLDEDFLLIIFNIGMQELIEFGAVTLMVPGNLPIGCLPMYLSTFMSSTKEDYDPETGCLIWLNEFAEYHNEMLRTELSRIQEVHPHVTIIYADYYNAAMRFYRSPSNYGTVLPFLFTSFSYHLRSCILTMPE